MIALLWAKIWKYVLMLGSLLAVIAGIFFEGRSKGVKSMQTKVDTADANVVVATTNANHLEARHEVDVEVAKLPDAPAQSVATAAPDTAAGKLRDEGWTRD